MIKKLTGLTMSFIMFFSILMIQNVYAGNGELILDNSISVKFPTYVGETKIVTHILDGDKNKFIETEKTVRVLELPKEGGTIFKINNYSSVTYGFNSVWFGEDEDGNPDNVNFYYKGSDDNLRLCMNEKGECIVSDYISYYKSPVLYSFNIENSNNKLVNNLHEYFRDNKSNGLFIEFILAPSEALNDMKIVKDNSDGGNSKQSPASEKPAETSVKFKDNYLKLNMPVIIKGDRSYFGMREIAEAIDAKVDWNSKTSTATATLNNNKVSFVIGSNKYKVNGVEKSMDAISFIESGRTYLPIRYICEGLGFKVDWDATTKTILIN